MFFSPPPRNLRAELLDLDEAPFWEVRESLKDVRRVNRYLSGYTVLLDHARPFLEAHTGPEPFTVLDAATGSADQPVALVKFARKLNIPIRITAIDINLKMLSFAREETARFPEIKMVQCDIHSLPFADESFDLTVNSLSLHHFTREGAIGIMRSLVAACRRGMIINDLHRSRIAWAAIYVLTRMLTQNRLTRFDAPVSVMNAFTPDEMTAMAEEAGIEGFKVHKHFPYRIALVFQKQGINPPGNES
jgi:2-polyprenyl-3-methyl-5-hydroxy-6-metoxy-1,4-benzoquinol methylase